jgi:hypothetical protein
LENPEENIKELMAAAKALGLNGVTPAVINNNWNLTVRLAPYPIVARVANLSPGEDPELRRETLAREIKVVRHLSMRGVPVVPYTEIVPPGPHRVGGKWMTLWEYQPAYPLPELGGEDAVDMIGDLAAAMADFKEPVPRLGVWRNVSRSAAGLRPFMKTDSRIAGLMPVFEQVDERIRSIDTLFPAHGDAHPRNLIASAAGWRWIDFEEVSNMPKFWDLASFIGNTALFHGLKHPVVDYVLTREMVARDKASFQFALKARVIMATMTNLETALHGNGDLDFAASQLEHIGDFLTLLDKGL